MVARGMVRAAMLDAQGVVRFMDGARVVQCERCTRGAAMLLNGGAIGNPVAALEAQHHSMLGLPPLQRGLQRDIRSHRAQRRAQARGLRKPQDALHGRVDGDDLLGLIHRQHRVLQRAQHGVELLIPPGLQPRHARQFQRILKPLPDAGARIRQQAHQPRVFGQLHHQAGAHHHFDAVSAQLLNAGARRIGGVIGVLPQVHIQQALHGLQLGQRLAVHHDADTAGLFSGADQGLQDVKAAELDSGHRRTQPPAQQTGIGSGTDESVHLPALQALPGQVQGHIETAVHHLDVGAVPVLRNDRHRHLPNLPIADKTQPGQPRRGVQVRPHGDNGAWSPLGFNTDCMVPSDVSFFG